MPVPSRQHGGIPVHYGYNAHFVFSGSLGFALLSATTMVLPFGPAMPLAINVFAAHRLILIIEALHQMSADPEAILRHEFNGEDDSFLIRLRCDLYWDAAAFKRLTQAMFQVAAAYEDRNQLPKWIAQGFWYAETFTRDWTAHPDFPKQADVDYAEGCEMLCCLSSYLFNGFSPLEDNQLAAWVGQD